MKKKVLLFILINLQETPWHNLYYPGLWIKSSEDTVALFSQCTGLKVKRSQFETWPVIVLSSWTKHFILTVPLSTQEWKRVLVYCQGNLMKFKWGGGGGRVTWRWTDTQLKANLYIPLGPRLGWVIVLQSWTLNFYIASLHPLFDQGQFQPIVL